MGLLLVGLCGQARAAGRNRDAEALALIDSFFEGSVSGNSLINRLSFFGSERMATQVLTDRLRRTVDPKRRGAMLEVLAQVAVPSDDGEVVLMRALGDETLGNRMSAAKALGRIKSAAALPKLEPMLADPVLGARREAARALGTIGKAKAGRALMAAAKAEEDLDTRGLMLVAVGRCGDQKQVAALGAYLEDPSGLTRFSAAQALCQLGAPKCQTFAKKLLASSEPLDRLQAIQLFEGVALLRAKPVLTLVLDDADHSVRAAAARVLAQAGDSTKTDWLIVESNKRENDPSAQLKYESEIEKLRVTPEQRAAILKKAKTP